MRQFGSNNVDRAGWRLKCAGWRWMELEKVEMSWVEVDGVGGGRWSSVEVGARFSNTLKQDIDCSTSLAKEKKLRKVKTRKKKYFKLTTY